MEVDTFLRTKLEERCTSMQAAFRKVDKSNNGVITAQDFEDVLRSFGLRVTRQGLASLMDTYDLNHDGFVSYEECALFGWNRPTPPLRCGHPVLT